MKKLNKIMLALSILPTLLTSVFLFFMNDTVPMHYNASGAVDRYGSKYENFILPAIILFMYAFYMVYTKIYTKYSTNSVEKINNNVKITAILVTSIIAAFNILQLMFLILAILKPDSTTFTDNVAVHYKYGYGFDVDYCGQLSSENKTKFVYRSKNIMDSKQ